MCSQQSLRSACSYAQSDQSLCLSLEYLISVKLLAEHHLEFLSLKGSYTGSSEYTLVKMSHCWKSRVTAQMHVQNSYSYFHIKVAQQEVANTNIFYNDEPPNVFTKTDIDSIQQNISQRPNYANTVRLRYLLSCQPRVTVM